MALFLQVIANLILLIMEVENKPFFLRFLLPLSDGNRIVSELRRSNRLASFRLHMDGNFSRK